MTKISSNELIESLRSKERALYEQICNLINADKKDMHVKFRAYGSGHSKLDHSPIFDSACMVDMQQYLEEPYLETSSIDTSDTLVVSAGMPLGKVRDFLAQYKLRLYGTPESETVTIGGAILCGAHNGSAHWHAMAYYVKELLLVDGTGKLRRVTDPNLFINYGLLGIVIRIKIAVFPAHNVQWTHTQVDAMTKLDISPNTYCLFFGPYSGRILKADITFTRKQRSRDMKRLLWDMLIYPLRLKLVARMIPSATAVMPWLGIFSSELFTYQPNVIRDKYDYFEPVPKAQTFTLEYAIARSHLASAYAKIMDIIAAYRKKGTYVLRFWCRFQPKTELNNDLSYGRSTVFVEVTINDRQPYARKLVQEVSKVLLAFDGKPHLAKTVLNVTDVCHYDFDILKEAIRKYDPEQRFQNKYTKLVFNEHGFRHR